MPKTIETSSPVTSSRAVADGWHEMRLGMRVRKSAAVRRRAEAAAFISTTDRSI